MVPPHSGQLDLHVFVASQVRVCIHIVISVVLVKEAGRPVRWINRQSPPSQILLDLLKE